MPEKVLRIGRRGSDLHEAARYQALQIMGKRH
jgi:hypothetical protein